MIIIIIYCSYNTQGKFPKLIKTKNFKNKNNTTNFALWNSAGKQKGEP